MHISRQNNLIAALAGSQNHALHGAGRSADHQERMRRAKGIRRQLFRFSNDGDRMAQNVQRLNAVDIHADALLSQKFRQFRIAAAAFVAWHIKGNHAHLAKIFQCFMDWRTALVARKMISVHISSVLAPTATKKRRFAQFANLRVIPIFLLSKVRHTAAAARKSEYGCLLRVYIAIITFTTLIDRFTSLRFLRNSGYKGTNL